MSSRSNGRVSRWWARGLVGLVCTIAAVGAFGLGQAGAARLSKTLLGVNVKVWHFNPGAYAPSDLSLASAAGAQVARIEADFGTNMDGVVRWLAQSHMRLYPILALPCPPGSGSCSRQTQIPPATAANEMAQYITAFAQRYGPKGAFWSANPGLPYLPVQRFEIGNEPNIRIIWVQDGTHLHWQDPSNPLIASAADYALVYEASRTALHRVDPTGKAVVGGLADGASFGGDVESGEALLNGLPRHRVDAVGYHPWVFNVSNSLLRPDTTDLRVWMDHHGFRGVPLDVNEFDSCATTFRQSSGQTCARAESSASWGRSAASYTKWALCTPWLHVKNLQPFVWGATPVSDQDIWLPLVASNGVVTAYGQRFLTQARTLTTSGCHSARTRHAKAPTHSTRPILHGRVTSGSMLTSSPGKWSGRPKPKLYWQWLRCDRAGRGCIAIGGALSRRYRLQSADMGSRISLLATAISTAGGATATSCTTRVILPTNYPAPGPANPCR